MKPGSVIVDLAVEQGGNVEGAVAGEVVETPRREDRRLPQHRRRACAADACALFAATSTTSSRAFWDKEAGKPVLDEEIGDAVRLTQGGKVVNERLLA